MGSASKLRVELPIEIIVEILSYLPVKSLLKFRCVCKKFNSLTREAKFLDLHRRRAAKTPSVFVQIFKDMNIEFSKLNDMDGIGTSEDKFTITGLENRYLTSNFVHGLTCICPFNNAKSDSLHCYFVNPSTKDFAMLPDIKFFFPDLAFSSMGFGFDVVTGKFKVVWLFIREDSFSDPVECLVFTLGTSKWRYLGEAIDVGSGPPQFSNGVLYWPMDDSKSSPPGLLVSFDIRKEEFSLITGPSINSAYKASNFDLIIIGGELCVAHTHQNAVLEVWVLKSYRKNVWRKEHIINLEHLSVNKPIVCVRSHPEGVLIVCRDECYVYNAQAGSFKRRIMWGSNGDPFVLTESLVSPKVLMGLTYFY